jgi:hypothetical protein
MAFVRRAFPILANGDSGTTAEREFAITLAKSLKHPYTMP